MAVHQIITIHLSKIKMKTLGELRKIIIENNGEFKIGGLIFKHSAGNDVDVHLDGRLIMWFETGEKDDALLTDKIYSIITTEEKTQDIGTDNTAKDIEKAVALGKVEAYEKILIGRDLTISK